MTKNISLQGKIYIVRLLFCLTTLALLGINDFVCRQQAGDHLWLLLGGLLYPHLGHLLFGRLDVSRRRGHVLFLADGMFVGAVIAALDFTPLPSVILIVISFFNWMVVGGAPLLALGTLFMAFGMVTMGVTPDKFSLDTTTACHVTNGLASLIAIGYFLIVAQIIHRLIRELRLKQVEFQAQSDSASSARVMAEQALLAVLPASAAQAIAENGTLKPESIPNACILLLSFQASDGACPNLEAMQDTLSACEPILSRHGLEHVKSFGGQALAFSRQASGPDDAVRAYLEIGSYLRDHGSHAYLLRGILHQGPVSLGLVQAERLNLDLFGPPMDEIATMAAHSMQRRDTGLLVSESTYQLLGNPSGYTAIPSPEAAPLFYRGSP
ncbi:MAG: MASE2 domain-containing protein [Pseudomonadota bacterium]